MVRTQAELRAKIDTLILALKADRGADREADRQILSDLQASRAELQASRANLQSAVTQLQAAWARLQPVLLKRKLKRTNSTTRE